jgi:hypothetical protein
MYRLLISLEGALERNCSLSAPRKGPKKTKETIKKIRATAKILSLFSLNGGGIGSSALFFKTASGEK